MAIKYFLSINILRTVLTMSGKVSVNAN